MQGNEVTVRSAGRQDAAALAALAREAFREAYLDMLDLDEIEDYVSKNFTPDSFGADLEDEASTVLVATLGPRLIGYAQVKRSHWPDCVTGPAPIELARLYLRREATGKGIGATLMRAVHAEARRRQGETLWLGVYDRNERARDFYKRWGFVDVGTKAFWFGGRSYDDPVMSAPVRVDV